jgi:hypothetical protein
MSAQEPGGPSIVERASGATVGLVTGWVLGSILTIIPAVGALEPLPWLVGGGIGAAYGAWSPPRFARMRVPLPEAVAGEPAPIGALAAVTIRDLERPTAVAMGIAAIIAIGSLPLGWAVYSLFGVRPSLTLLGFLAVLALALAMACMAFLPALLLDPAKRAALAAHAWLGARETARAFGSRNAIRGLPTKTDAIAPWIASHPEADANREVHVELHLMRGDWEAARATLERLPDASPRDRFTREMLRAMLRYQMGDDDDQAARSAADGIPPGPDAIEARVALATLEARRRLPGDDWREPLVEARRLIPESDTTILLRDHGAVSFTLLMRVGWPILALLLLMTLVIGPMVDGGAG